MTRRSTDDKPSEHRAIVIERQGSGWWVVLDGKLLGAVLERSETVLPEIRLAVEGGPAWFSDITVEELIAAT